MSIKGKDDFELVNNINKIVKDFRDKVSLFGKGYGRGAGLWNDEIDEIMRDTPNYLGTYSVDDLPEIFKHIASDKPRRFGLILNTNTEHWIAINFDGSSLEFYDSLCEWKPSKLLIDDFSKALSYLPYRVKFKINDVKQQADNTANCGWFCCKFLDERSRGISFKDATNYPRTVGKGEEDIRKYKNKFRLI